MDLPNELSIAAMKLWDELLSARVLTVYVPVRIVNFFDV